MAASPLVGGNARQHRQRRARGDRSMGLNVRKKPSEGKAPILGRSARERVKAREKTEAGAQNVAKRRNNAIETRSRVVVGDAALRYAPRHPSVRNLIATAIQESGQEDVRRRLARAIHGEPPLENTPFDDAWGRWERLRSLNQKIESAWAGLKLLLAEAPDADDEVYDTAFAVLEELAIEWEKLMGIVHPIGRLMRISSPN